MAWAAGLLTIGLLLSSCGSDFDQEEIPLQEDPQLLSRAQQVIRDGGSVLLREIAGGEWDQVYVFPGPSLRESVENTVGAPIDMPDIYNHEGGGIIVFAKADTVQRAVALLPYPFDGHGGTYGPDVTVARPNPNAGYLTFTDTSRTTPQPQFGRRPTARGSDGPDDGRPGMGGTHTASLADHLVMRRADTSGSSPKRARSSVVASFT